MHVKRVALCATLITMCAPLVGACGAVGAGQASNPPSSGTVRMQPASTTTTTSVSGVPTPPSPELSARLRDAKPDALIATGKAVRVERVKARLRLQISGEFRMMNSKTYVYIGGKVIGEGVTSRDLHTLTVAVVDRALITNGAEVAYSYGIGRRPTVVGTMRTVK